MHGALVGDPVVTTGEFPSVVCIGLEVVGGAAVGSGSLPSPLILMSAQALKCS